MKTKRRHLFETNSSSTHVLTMCTEEEYQKWLDGKLVWYSPRGILVPVEEKNKQRFSEDYMTKPEFDKYVEEILYDCGGDVFEQSYNGIKAFGFYTQQ